MASEVSNMLGMVEGEIAGLEKPSFLEKVLRFF